MRNEVNNWQFFGFFMLTYKTRCVGFFTPNFQNKTQYRRTVSFARSHQNYHQVQCESIPETISDDHGIHMTPCYKKFTLILARCDNKESGETRSSKRN